MELLNREHLKLQDLRLLAHTTPEVSSILPFGIVGAIALVITSQEFCISSNWLLQKSIVTWGGVGIILILFFSLFC